MAPFVRESGIAAALPLSNVDTDVIMPKQFLKIVDREGLAGGAFHDLRFEESGAERSGFVLNQAPWRDSRFLIAGANFGCGSSREHAVWGLRQWGIRAIAAESFGAIFADNCAKNGVLAAMLPPASIAELMQAAADPARCRITFDLERQVVEGESLAQLHFQIDALARETLLSGRDSIATTLEYADDIRAFEQRHHASQPWLFDRHPDRGC
jgi:3-isopropylmalate/(R)-2-methylmalate dehydratase small subunit